MYGQLLLYTFLIKFAIGKPNVLEQNLEENFESKDSVPIYERSNHDKQRIIDLDREVFLHEKEPIFFLGEQPCEVTVSSGSGAVYKDTDGEVPIPDGFALYIETPSYIRFTSYNDGSVTFLGSTPCAVAFPPNAEEDIREARRTTTRAPATSKSTTKKYVYKETSYGGPICTIVFGTPFLLIAGLGSAYTCWQTIEPSCTVHSVNDLNVVESEV